ncbi:unnamed protein product, partial [Meganyctiphanes norvegica]
YQCRLCDKAFSQNRDLIKHMRIHTREKTCQCNLCDKAFSMNCYLIKHLRTHTGEKTYQCRQCDKAFSLKTYLISHISAASVTRLSHKITYEDTYRGEIISMQPMCQDFLKAQ